MGTKRIINMNATTDFESDDNIVVDSTTAGTRKMAQSVLKEKLREDCLAGIHNLTPATDFATGDTIVVDNATDGPRGMDKDVLLAKTAQNTLGSIKNLPTSITAFRTGDVIPVDGPSGTAKMPKDTLKRILSPNVEVNTDSFTVDNKYIAKPWQTGIQDGSLQSDNTFYTTDFFEVAENEEVTCNFSGFSIYSYCTAFYDENKTFIAGKDTAGSYSAPSGSAFVRFCVKKSVASPLASLFVNVPERLDELKSDISSLSSTLDSLDDKVDENALYEDNSLGNDDFSIDGKFIAKAYSAGIQPGSLQSDENFKTTDFIEIKSVERCVVAFPGFSIYSYCTAFYDENKTFIAGYDAAGTYSPPSNATFVRFCYRKNVSDKSVHITISIKDMVANHETRLTDVENLVDEINERTKVVGTKCVADVNLMLTIGQSLSFGATIWQLDLTTENYYGTRELSGNASIGFGNNVSVVENNALVDSDDVEFVTNKVCEMPCRGMTLEYLKLLHDDESFDFNSHENVLANIGTGGISIQNIVSHLDGTKNTLKALIDKIRNEGKSVGIPVIGFIQGEANDRDFDLGEKWLKLTNFVFDELSKFVLDNSDNLNPPTFLLYQTSGYEAFSMDDKRLNIALRQYELATKRRDTFLVSPMYAYKFWYDCTHIRFFGTRNAGANMGVYAKSLAIDGIKKPWLKVLKHTVFKVGEKWQIRLQCEVPVAPLVIDDKNIESTSTPKTWEKLSPNDREYAPSSIDNCGFELFNTDWTIGEDTTPIRSGYDGWKAPKFLNWYKQDIIENVAIGNSGNDIIITCTADPTGLELHYARRGCQGGGLIHDSQTETINIEGYGATPVYNWLPIFRIVV